MFPQHLVKSSDGEKARNARNKPGRRQKSADVVDARSITIFAGARAFTSRAADPGTHTLEEVVSDANPERLVQFHQELFHEPSSQRRNAPIFLSNFLSSAVYNSWTSLGCWVAELRRNSGKQMFQLCAGLARRMISCGGSFIYL
jgi:hypothetical protein